MTAKRIYLVFILLAFSAFASANTKAGRSLYDVVAPVIFGNPDQDLREVGQIYYDSNEGEFKGINHEGDIEILSNMSSNGARKVVLDSPSSTIDTGGAPSDLLYSSVTIDTENGYNVNTGIYTTSYGGIYSVNVSVLITDAGLSSQDQVVIGLSVNGIIKRKQIVLVESQATEIQATLATTINLDQEDEVKPFIQVIGGSGATIVDTDGPTSWFSMHRVD